MANYDTETKRVVATFPLTWSTTKIGGGLHDVEVEKVGVIFDDNTCGVLEIRGGTSFADAWFMGSTCRPLDWMLEREG